MNQKLLADALGATARWRELIAEDDFPEDTRNLACARALAAHAEFVENLTADDPLIRRLDEIDLDYTDVLTFGEVAGPFAIRIGFHVVHDTDSSPRHNLSTLIDLIADEHPRRVPAGQS